MDPDHPPTSGPVASPDDAADPITLEQLEDLWEELAELARSIRRQRNQRGHSYLTSDVLISALRRLARDRAKRLTEGSELTWESRAKFFAAAATAMHRALVDHIREKVREKRGGGKYKRLPLDDAMILVREDPSLLFAVHECVERLTLLDPELGALAERKVFTSLTNEDLSVVFGIPKSTIERRWRERIRPYLQKHLNEHSCE